MLNRHDGVVGKHSKWLFSKCLCHCLHTLSACTTLTPKKQQPKQLVVMQRPIHRCEGNNNGQLINIFILAGHKERCNKPMFAESKVCAQACAFNMSVLHTLELCMKFGHRAFSSSQSILLPAAYGAQVTALCSAFLCPETCPALDIFLPPRQWSG